MPRYSAGSSGGGLGGANIIINELGDSFDFRVETDDETHALFVDGTTNRVSIGDSTDAPTATLEITNHASTGASGAPLLVLNSNDTDKSGLILTASHDETASAISSTATYLQVSSSVGNSHLFQTNADNQGNQEVSAATIKAAKSTNSLAINTIITSDITGLLTQAIDSSTGVTTSGSGRTIAKATGLRTEASVPTFGGNNASHAVGLVAKASDADLNDAALFFGKVVVSDTDTLSIIGPTTSAPGFRRNVFTFLLSGSDGADGMQFLINDSSVTAGQLLGELVLIVLTVILQVVF